MMQTIRLGLVGMVLLGVWMPETAEARRYRYTLNAARAESILARLPIRNRLTDEDWFNLVGEKRQDKYKVRRGDTLWRISRRSFRNPFLWRKLWEVNPALGNPHDLEVGLLLNYDRDSRDIASAEIPIIKLVPSNGVLDLDLDVARQNPVRQKYRPELVIVKEEDIVGEITGSYHWGRWLGEFGEPFIKFFDGEPAKGTLFSLARVEQTIYDRTSEGSPSLGVLMLLLGEISTGEVGDKYTRAEVKRMNGPIQRGDKVIRYQKTTPLNSEFRLPPDGLRTRIVQGDRADTKMFGQGQIVLLNQGKSGGMEEGYRFRVFHDIDPVEQSYDGVEPDFKGEVQIISVSERASIGYVVRNTEPIEVGDTLIPTHAFADPPAPPQRPREIIEFDR